MHPKELVPPELALIYCTHPSGRCPAQPVRLIASYPRLGYALMADDDLDHYRTAIVSGERLGRKVELDPRGVELMRRIERAFANWPSNAGLTWVQGEMLDNHEPDDILREGAHIGAYNRWQDVPPELLAAFPSAAGFIDDAGANFYWPALMVWELLYGPTYESATPADRLEDWSDRLRPKTEEQSQAFAEYKQYISDRWRRG
jgi:hypothetical protein